MDSRRWTMDSGRRKGGGKVGKRVVDATLLGIQLRTDDLQPRVVR